jgi:hypothetical protein
MFQQQQKVFYYVNRIKLTGIITYFVQFNSKNIQEFFSLLIICLFYNNKNDFLFY